MCRSELRWACALMESPSAKRIRLIGIAELKARLPYIPSSALAAVLKVAKDTKLLEVHNRKALRQSRQEYVTQSTTYGPIHQRMDIAEDLSTEVQHPMAMLWHCAKYSQSFSSLLQWCLSKFTSDLAHQWRIILYSDEGSPGNQLAYKHERKTWAVYWSFMEFGPALSCEDIMRMHLHMHD